MLESSRDGLVLALTGSANEGVKISTAASAVIPHNISSCRTPPYLDGWRKTVPFNLRQSEMKPYFFNVTVKGRIFGKSECDHYDGERNGDLGANALERVLRCRVVTFTADHSDAVLHKNQHRVVARLSGALHLS